MIKRWLERFGSLGQALLELLQAEVGALTDDLRASGRRLGVALLLFVVALFVVFWWCGVLTYTLVELLALWLPRWGAALSVAGILALVAAVFALVGYLRLRRLEAPAATVRRHLDSSVDWWQSRVIDVDRARELPEGDE